MCISYFKPPDLKWLNYQWILTYSKISSVEEDLSDGTFFSKIHPVVLKEISRNWEIIIRRIMGVNLENFLNRSLFKLGYQLAWSLTRSSLVYFGFHWHIVKYVISNIPKQNSTRKVSTKIKIQQDKSVKYKRCTTCACAN